MVKFGYWLLVQLIAILLGTLVMVALSLSPQSSPKVDYYMNWIWVPWIMLFFEMTVHFITGTLGLGGGGWSLFPLGSEDPDSFPLQRILGYDGAVAIAIVCMVFLGIFFYWTVHTSGQVWIPVPRMLIQSGNLQSAPMSTREFFSGRSALGNAVADSVPATMIENSLLLYSFMLIIWVPIRVIMTFLGIDIQTANLLGLLGFILITPLIFPYVFHAWAYQEVQPSYTKAMVFAFLTLVPTALTGIPCAGLGHMGNNAASVYMVTVGYWVVSVGIWFLVSKTSLPDTINSLWKRIKGLK